MHQTSLVQVTGWADIVAGQSLNLNAIHTIIITSHTVNKHKESIGDVELTYGIVEQASKKIGTQHHWNVAWNRVVRALKFAFPYQQAEFNAYLEHINEQFDQQLETCHGQVIHYDKSAHFRVGNSWKYELDDFESFKDLYSSHFSAGGKLHNDGGESTKSTIAGQDSSVRGDPCRKWNTGECTRSTATCRYAHVCNFEQDSRVCSCQHIRTKQVDKSKTKST
jgi:hypothetical protein